MQFARARIGIGPTDAVLDREDLPQRAADSAVARREGPQYTPDPRSRARTSMKIHVPDGIACTTAAEAEKAFQDLGAPLAVVKAQIHAGGRGKAGGVKLVRSAEEARAAAERKLGKALITHQNRPQGASSSACSSRRAPRSPRSTTSPSQSTARRRSR